MSQNRQDTKDRLRSELDFNVDRRAEAEIQGLARRLDLLDQKIGDVGNLLRSAANVERPHRADRERDHGRWPPGMHPERTGSE
jgi:uncharacterized membrane protein